MIDRRQLIAGGLAAMVLTRGVTAGANASVPYGAGLYLPDLRADPIGMAVALRQYCQFITPVTEFKWDPVRAVEGVFDFSGADELVAFAEKEGLGVYGHTLVWHAFLPEWINTVSGTEAAERLMVEHIETLVGRYAKTVRIWDVVNEAIPDWAEKETDRRAGFWQDRLGSGYISRAFQTARSVDPDAVLVLNEYDLEFATRASSLKRAAFLNLVREMLDDGTPLNAIGLQGHLRGGVPIATEEFAALLDEFRGMGLEILVTELDVQDGPLPTDSAVRDQLIADQVADFLGAVFAGGLPRSVATWGISDQYSWIRWAFPREDGTASRPLPLDWDFRTKPFMQVLQSFISAAA